ncbi:hypothetical protein E4U54_002483 [Claviceps lovelessii]|nr:hypothetical protein E4U54_002483 [Claviceps lovelessii]
MKVITILGSLLMALQASASPLDVVNGLEARQGGFCCVRISPDDSHDSKYLYLPRGKGPISHTEGDCSFTADRPDASNCNRWTFDSGPQCTSFAWPLQVLVAGAEACEGKA